MAIPSFTLYNKPYGLFSDDEYTQATVSLTIYYTKSLAENIQRIGAPGERPEHLAQSLVDGANAIFRYEV